MEYHMPSKKRRRKTSQTAKNRSPTTIPMTDNVFETTYSNQLRILQYNIAKSREITDSVLNDKSTSQYTVLLLQEQYWSSYQNSFPLHQSWTLIEPTTTGECPPRTAICINNKALTSGAFHQLNIPNNDIAAISITRECNRSGRPTFQGSSRPRFHRVGRSRTKGSRFNLDPGSGTV